MRIVADMIRGKNVSQAKLILQNAAKKAKHPLSDLVDSAMANAKHNFKVDADLLIVKEIRVDRGIVMKRFRPVSRGSAHPIKKKTSHVSITLAPMAPSKSQKIEKPKSKHP